MKPTKSISIFFSAIALFLTFTSCSKDEDNFMIWDIYPVDFYLVLTDENGNKLCDSLTAESKALLEAIEVEYNNVTYKVNLEDTLGYTPYGTSNRACLALFKGLYLRPYNFNSKNLKYNLCFGEMPGDKSYDMSFTIKWPDGKKDRVDFSNKFYWKFKEPYVQNTTLINGEKSATGTGIWHVHTTN